MSSAARPQYGLDKLMGININDTRQDFTGQILSGEKTVETRDTKSLHPYVGRRIGILSTHDTRSRPRVTYLVGFATVGEPKFYDNAADFDADYDLHRVAPGSDFHIDDAKYGVKWGYPVHDVKRIDPVAIDAKGNVARDLTPYMHLAISEDHMHTARVDAAEQTITKRRAGRRAFSHSPSQAESLNPVMSNSNVTTEELLLAASILKRIAIRNKYEQLDAHWVGTAAFDELGNGQPQTEEWQQWSLASTFVDDVDKVASAMYAYLQQASDV